MVDYDENSVTSELSFSNDHKKNKVYPNKHREGKSEKEKENARKWGKRERERECVCVWVRENDCIQLQKILDRLHRHSLSCLYTTILS